MKELRIYRTRHGKEPFIRAFEAIKDKVALAHINTRIRRLILGQYGDCKRLQEDVWELRIHHRPGYRIYFAELGKQIIVVLSVGNKTFQAHDIKQAIAYWQDYKERYHA